MTDKELEELWEDFGDVPINEEEEIDVDWRDWPKGTDRYEIWHWFDDEHSKGVHWLLLNMGI